MPLKHKVAKGECVLSIATRHGLMPETVWNHAENSELRSKRKDMNVLKPGDVLTIPDARVTEVSKPAEKRHRFRRKGVPGKIKIQILENGEPRKNESYTLDIDGTRTEGTTDDQGYVSFNVPAEARRGEVSFYNTETGGTDTFSFNLGTVDPIETEEGQAQRLSNLGYDTESGLESGLESAIEHFQSDHGLEVTGQADRSTLDKLKEVFGQ